MNNRENTNKKTDKKNIGKKITIKKELKEFINEHIAKKTKFLFIIGIVVMIFLISTISISDVNMVEEGAALSESSLSYVLKQRVIFLLLIILAGVVPYFYISVIAFIAYMFIGSTDIIASMEINGALAAISLNILPVIIDVFTASVITAVGIYMCNYNGKKYKYAQRSSFTMLDVKIRFYEMTKQEEKYKAAMAKKDKRLEEMQKNDVKIDYKQIFKIVPIMVLINLIVCLIQYYIN